MQPTCMCTGVSSLPAKRNHGCSCEPSLQPGRHAVRCAEELLQQVFAQLPRKVPEPEQLVEEIVNGGPT